MPTLFVDGQEVTVPDGSTILQAVEAAGKEVPVFCFHPRLNIAGNCRMCLVQLEDQRGMAPKPAASCAMPAADGLKVHTNNEMVDKAQKGVLELLLINHPLDCPICDQGGECDLQDLAMHYGADTSRFDENKRSVLDKDIGPLISTHMNRCIHCTRCVRFATEVAGVEEIGALGRGEHMEIGTYVTKAVESELSGNMIDLCPVGALNSKPYEYKARSWELTRTETIDVHDAVGCNIRVDVRGTAVLRVVPSLNEDINEEWISDKARFAHDGLLKRRLDVPMIRQDGKLQPASWAEAFDVIAEKMNATAPDRMAALVGDLADCESIKALKDLCQSYGMSNMDCRSDGAGYIKGQPWSWRFNATIAGIEDADCCLIVGSQTRWDATIVNARLRKRYRQGGFSIGRVGVAEDLTFPVTELGDQTDVLSALLSGEHAFSEQLKNAERPLIILGPDVLADDQSQAVFAWLSSMAERYGVVSADWNGLCILHRDASRVGAMELGFVPGANGRNWHEINQAGANGELDLVWLLNADNNLGDLEKAFVVYQGHHGDEGASRADVILPGAAYTEKSSFWVNTEGRAQRSRMAMHPPGEAREDWRILRAFSAVAGKTLPYDDQSSLRAAMAADSPVFGMPDMVVPAEFSPVSGDVGGIVVSSRTVSRTYYQTNVVARASEVLRDVEASRSTGNGEAHG